VIRNERVLGVIPARGGSKRLPRKNVRPLAGKPLIAWTIEAARGSRYLDRVVLSSDDAEIIRVARQWNCEAPFVRPAELASDEAPGVGPVLHAVQALPDYALVVLLQPTSPLRTSADIDACIEACVERGAPACVSVCAAQENPHWMFTLDAGGRLSPVMSGKLPDRSQDLPPAYLLNGAVYVARTDWLRERREFISPQTVAYVMPADRSTDIDDADDLRHAESLMQRKESWNATAGPR
jgi:N-acylneuraminate cytidylyltransferase